MTYYASDMKNKGCASHAALVFRRGGTCFRPAPVIYENLYIIGLRVRSGNHRRTIVQCHADHQVAGGAVENYGRTVVQRHADMRNAAVHSGVSVTDVTCSAPHLQNSGAQSSIPLRIFIFSILRTASSRRSVGISPEFTAWISAATAVL